MAPAGLALQGKLLFVLILARRANRENPRVEAIGSNNHAWQVSFVERVPSLPSSSAIKNPWNLCAL